MKTRNRFSDMHLQSHTGKPYFTLAEANRALVLVKRIIGDVVAEYACLLELLEMIEAAESPPDSAAEGVARPTSEADEYLDRAQEQLARTSRTLRTCLDELDDVGVELTDWSSGSVVFPSVVGGREVDLCWQHGEPRILYWQEAHRPGKRRRPIEALLAEMATADAAAK